MDRKKIKLFIALTVAMFLAAVEGTIVVIAVPTIAKDLMGFEYISSIFSAFFLVAAVSTPLYGKLADLYGRKKMLTIGMIIFTVGSLLCGLSQSMLMLIIARAVQGLGAGAIFTIAFTIVGDAYTLEEKPKVMGGLSSIWGIASLVGPFIGGFLIDTFSWHWIFLAGVPLGVLSIIVLHVSLEDNFERSKPIIDYAGITVFTLALLSFLAVFMANDFLGWETWVFLSTFLGATLALLVLFYFIEKKAPEPLLPFNIFTKVTILVNLVSFLLAVILIGIDMYIPIYIQDVLGYSALISGLAFAPMSASWIIASVVLGNLIPRFGAKGVVLISNSMLLASAVLLIFIGANTTIWAIIIITFIMGAGFGGAWTTLTIVIQSSVRYAQRGAAMGANALFRTLGHTIGISILGSAFNFFIARYYIQRGVTDIDLSNLYSSLSATESLIPGDQVRMAINTGLDYVYIVFIAIATLCVLLTLLTPEITIDDEEETADEKWGEAR